MGPSITPAPIYYYIDFRYSRGLYAEYIGRYVSCLKKKNAWKNVLKPSHSVKNKCDQSRPLPNRNIYNITIFDFPVVYILLYYIYTVTITILFLLVNTFDMLMKVSGDVFLM